MDIDLTGLLVFRHIAETGSFTETGKYWKISQPSVSVMVSRLESAVGLVLLERSSSGTRLTPAGKVFLEQVREVCDNYLAFIDGMRALGRRTDRVVKVGIDKSWFGERVRDSLGKLSASQVGVELQVCELREEWWECLCASQCDVVVAGRFLRAGLSTAVQEAVICRERGLTVAWNPAFYAFNADSLNFPDVLKTTILIPDCKVVTGFAEFLLHWCESAYGMQPANVIKFSTEAEAASAAVAGLGVLLSPGDATRRPGLAGTSAAHVRTFEFLLPEAFTFGVYCRSGEESKEVLSYAAAICKLGRKFCVNPA